MTPKRIKELRDLIAAATPGPWTITSDWDSYAVSANDIDMVSTKNRAYRAKTLPNFGSSLQDANFIAEARTALPEALDEIEGLREEIDKIEDKTKDAWHAGFEEGLKAGEK